jgi:hypothetical protein
MYNTKPSQGKSNRRVVVPCLGPLLLCCALLLRCALPPLGASRALLLLCVCARWPWVLALLLCVAALPWCEVALSWFVAIPAGGWPLSRLACCVRGLPWVTKIFRCGDFGKCGLSYLPLRCLVVAGHVTSRDVTRRHMRALIFFCMCHLPRH